eukprot:TRINITY_DN5102_c0_g1_i1.p2 TRINITY_DN5102_c0_g1~~TRINITY_DN5102_c0_g1_i1.p2  ORF type:complete len:160 (-),score=29.37 TRINITY_DN5102_c0_g1_i1:168-647(-)
MAQWRGSTWAVAILVAVFSCVSSVSASCNTNADCSGRGACVGTTCVCEAGYASNDCSYELKDLETAFFLAFFLGNWGIDHWYLGSNAIALMKAALSWVFLSAMLTLRMWRSWPITPVTNAVRVWVPFGIGGLVFAWWVTDWAMIAAGETKDANGYPLMH